MAISFPGSPLVNDTFTSGGVTYTWDGTVWVSSGPAAFVKKSGDTMTGDLGVTTINSLQYPTAGPLSNRNKIINGDMRIDQRNAGASLTPTNGDFSVDRWEHFQSDAGKYSVQQNSGSVTPPAGFSYYLGAVSLSAHTSTANQYFSLQQTIEGYNVADLEWGTANAKTVTVSFWVRSSLTGTFGGSLKNLASGATRSYPFTFAISAANTWEHKTITVAGDTTGTWGTTNADGICLSINLGTGTTYSGTAGAWAASNYLSATGAVSLVGTSGATLYLTGVQLEVGSVATPFEHRSYGDELARCQRYFQYITYFSGSTSYAVAGTYYHFGQHAATAMRTTPAAPTPANSGTLSITSSGQDGYRYPFVYPSTGATLSSFYTAACNAEL